MVRIFERNEDMSPHGRLRIILQEDGDAIVCVVPDPDADGLRQSSVEFCSRGAGGGRSRHTLEAVRALADAIRRDNEESPLPDSGNWEVK